MTGKPEAPRTIISLAQHVGSNAASLDERVFQHWSALARDGTVPRRSDLCPRALGPALPHAFLVEQARPGIVRFRLAGRHLADLMGMDVRGMPLRAFFEIPDRRPLMAQVGQVFDAPATLRLDLVSAPPGRSALSGQMMILPMADRNGAITRALGLLTTRGTIGLAPRRFQVRGGRLSPLGRVPDSAQHPPRPERGRPQLTLIEGGRA